MNKAQILIVEDEGLIAKDLQAMLKRLGYHVPVTVGTGELAIETAAQNKPDLILMDIQLRGKVDGVEAAESIKSLQDVPVVFLTANSDETNFQRAKLTDPFGFLIKPFEERSLHANIEMALYKHKTEKQIREREQWLSTTLKSIADGVMTTDSKGRITFLNSVAEKLLGWSNEEAMGKHYTEIFCVIEESSRVTPVDAVTKAVSEGLSGTTIDDNLLVQRDGTEIHIEHSVAPIRNNDQMIAGYVIVFCDVSQQRKLEQDLRQSQKMDAIGKLAGSVAHDFNNAITAVMGYSSIMLAKIPESDPMYDDASQILQAAEHSARLTRQLLAFSRKEILHPVRMNLGTAIQGMKGLLRRLIRENIELEISAPADLWEISADPGHCEQLVFNMSINARDAMPKGGKLSIGVSNVTLTPDAAFGIRGSREGEFVALQISDTGVGMSREVMDRIFEPFFTTKGRDRGTGLGLSTCEGIVRQVKGFINVNSTPGAGTAFTIYIPRTEKTEVQVETASVEAGGTSGGSETILVVEDEDAVRMLTTRVLEDLGYTVLEAENGIAAISALERCPEGVDMIISDLVMPEMSGRELVEYVQKTFCNTKILFMSGYTDDDIVNEAVTVSEVAFLQKPFTPTILAGKVREVLSAPAFKLAELSV
jgi:two-component system, cell cycle sensor histidine kinase and response regulator CckA